MRILAASLLLGLMTAPSARAQGQGTLEISASVNRDSLTLEEQVMLNVTVSASGMGFGNSAPEPRMPAMPKFNVHSAGRSQNISFINGRVSTSIKHSYVLVPRFVGKAIIPPITVRAGGQAAATDPIEITVLRPSTPDPQPRPKAQPARRRQPPRKSGRLRPSRDGKRSPPLFVTAETDKKTPYVNEQVILTVRFHTAVPLLGNAEWEPPHTQGFLKEDLPPPQGKSVSLNGRTYYVTPIRMALFPIQPGKLKIGPTVIRCQVQKQMRVDPFSPDFFQRFFSQGLMGPVSRELKTKPISLTARALPEAGKPKDFTGAVGLFRVSAKVDRRKVKVGEAVTLSVTVQGRGNLKALGDLALPEMDTFRVFETVTSLSTGQDQKGIQGSKTYKTVLVPRVSGELKIPAIPFNFFEPKSRKYVTRRTSSIRITAAPGEKKAAPAVAFQGGEPDGGEITKITADIRHIKSAPDDPAVQRLASMAAGAGWLHLAPLSVFLLALSSVVYRNRILQDPAGARSRRALSQAMRRVRDARRGAGPEQCAALLFETLSNYAADKLNRPASGLTLRDAQKAFRERFPGVPEGHLEQMRVLWQELEMFRFAPQEMQSSDASSLADGVRELVKALDEEISK